jgi:hypothetical protein
MMYVRTGEGLGLSPYVQNSSSVYLGEPKPAIECLRYEKGEREKSHCLKGPCQKGHLELDVLQIPRGLLIADFGVGWSGVKKDTKEEKLLYAFTRYAKSDIYSIILRIFGFSDCVGLENNNTELRRKRANSVYYMLGDALRARVDFVGAAPAGEYIAGNKTKEGRANNRGVVIELWRLPEQIIDIKDRKLPIPCPGCEPPKPLPPIPCPDCKPRVPACVSPTCTPQDPDFPPKYWVWPWSPPKVIITQDFPPDDTGGSSWVWGPIKAAATFLGIGITIGLRRLSNVELQDAIDAAWLVFQLEQGGLKAVIGLAGEAAAEKILASVIGVDASKIFNLNSLAKSFPVLDLMAPTGVFSVKTRGLLGLNAPLNSELVREYTQDLIDFAVGEHPRAARKLPKAAKLIFNNRTKLKASGSWPSDLIANSAQDVEKYIRQKAKLLVPHDHYQILRKHVGAALNARVKKGLKLPAGTDPVAWVQSFVFRIDSIGVKSSDLQVLLEATKHLPKEQVGRLLKELAALKRRRRGL